MQTVFAGLFGRVMLGLAAGPLIALAAMFLALVVGGFVTGHFVAQGRVTLFYGAFVAVLYIALTATVQSARDAMVAHDLGFMALPPIDLIQLTIDDVLAMTGATCGAWLAVRSG